MNLTEILDDLVGQLNAAGGDLTRRALKALALEEYKSGHITKAEVRRLLGFSTRYELDGFLKAREVWADYTIGWGRFVKHSRQGRAISQNAASRPRGRDPATSFWGKPNTLATRGKVGPQDLAKVQKGEMKWLLYRPSLGFRRGNA